MREPEQSTRSGAAGFTLIEVVICAGILAIAAVGAAAAILTSTHLNSRVSLETTALAAAEDKLAEIRGTPFASIVGTFTGQTFAVDGLPSPAGAGVDPGEVIIINSEAPNEASYGRNLGAEGGAGPGVDLNGNGRTNDILTGPAFGVDIDGDAGYSKSPAVYTATVANMTTAPLLPVVVLIRWRTGEGIQRVQLMTTVINRTP